MNKRLFSSQDTGAVLSVFFSSLSDSIFHICNSDYKEKKKTEYVTKLLMQSPIIIHNHCHALLTGPRGFTVTTRLMIQ